MGEARAARLARRAGLAALAAFAACAHGERAWEARCDEELARLVAAARAPAPQASGFLDWASLRNPILALPDRSLKDQSVVWQDGVFYVFASTRFEEDDPERASKIPSFYRSPDLRRFEAFDDPDLNGPGHGPGSPDVVRTGQLWHMVFQAPTGRSGTLMLSTSRDLVAWTPPVDLGPRLLDPAVRNIDGALARDGTHFYLGWKRDQSFFVTRSAGADLDGRWVEPQPVDARLRFGPSSLSHAWAENYQFLRIDGAWHMVATARASGLPVSRHPYTGSHEPYLYLMDGGGQSLADWTRWICKRELLVPREDWNPAMHANSGFLADWREHDGHFYLFYAGSADHERFGGRGHGKIGVVRSRDLVHWAPPGDLDDSPRE